MVYVSGNHLEISSCEKAALISTSSAFVVNKLCNNFVANTFCMFSQIQDRLQRTCASIGHVISENFVRWKVLTIWNFDPVNIFGAVIRNNLCTLLRIGWLFSSLASLQSYGNKASNSFKLLQLVEEVITISKLQVFWQANVRPIKS